MNFYDMRHEWRLGALPVAAALGIEPEAVWLNETVPGYGIAGAGAKILACSGVPEAYIPREVLTWWHSAAGVLPPPCISPA
jgi:hypothetical protein